MSFLDWETISASITTFRNAVFMENMVRQAVIMYLLLTPLGMRGTSAKNAIIPLIIRYDLLREPNIGILSAISPYNSLIHQGKLIIADMTCISAGSKCK